MFESEKETPAPIIDKKRVLSAGSDDLSSHKKTGALNVVEK